MNNFEGAMDKPQTQNETQSTIEKLISRQLNTINIVIAAIGIMFLIAISGLGYLQIKSSDELSKTAKEMKDDLRYNMDQLNKGFEKDIKDQQSYIENYNKGIEKRIDTKLADFEKRFNQIAGEATEPALLNIYYKGEKVFKNTLFVPYRKTGSKKNQYAVRIPRFIIKNEGGKPTNIVNVYISSDHNLSSGGFVDSYPFGYWNKAIVQEGSEFISKLVFYLGENSIQFINPDEFWSMEIPEILTKDLNDSIKIRIEIYYGLEKPTTADILFKSDSNS